MTTIPHPRYTPEDEQSEAAIQRVLERKSEARDRVRGGDGAGFRIHQIVEG